MNKFLWTLEICNEPLSVFVTKLIDSLIMKQIFDAILQSSDSSEPQVSHNITHKIINLKPLLVFSCCFTE